MPFRFSKKIIENSIRWWCTFSFHLFNLMSWDFRKIHEKNPELNKFPTSSQETISQVALENRETNTFLVSVPLHYLYLLAARWHRTFWGWITLHVPRELTERYNWEAKENLERKLVFFHPVIIPTMISYSWFNDCSLIGVVMFIFTERKMFIFRKSGISWKCIPKQIAIQNLIWCKFSYGPMIKFK